VPVLEQAIADGLIAVVDEGDPDAFPQLGRGESSVLSACARACAGALIDERRARAVLAGNADLLQAIPIVTGVVGLVLLAKRHGAIAAVRPLLDQLRDEGFRIGQELYVDALRTAGEL
jgi:predicted nucleic acid-binding protein